jgi:tetratricopeptide (TPR) repeat protein
MLVQLEHDGAIDIPAGAREVVVSDELVLPVAVDVLAVYPHAHYLGKDVQGEAVLPDGSREWLVHIKDWDVNWQAVYRLATPLRLPKGTRLTMRWTYDNTAENVRNPHRPPQRVRAGNRAEDEMAHLWLQVLPRPENAPGAARGTSTKPGSRPGGVGPRADPAAADPRLSLQEALMRRRLVKSPADASARYNLGAALLALGRLDDAVRELQEAARQAPGRATVKTTLGSAYQAQGQTERALRAYREAVRLDPTYVNAQFDLGQLLLSSGREREALPFLRAAARLEPEDAVIHAQLGAALQKAGETGSAIESLKRALALDPEQDLARHNLAQALAATGELASARGEYEALLQRRPHDPDAHRGLGLVLAGLGREPEAVHEFRAVLARRPDDLEAHDALGQLLLGVAATTSGTEGAWPALAPAVEAIAHLRVVVKGRPDDADAWNNLGSALAMQGNLPEAVRSFERALAVDPSHAAARANLTRARATGPPP